MEYYTEPERKIPVVENVDVLIAGGGLAGIGATIAAARHGCRTMLVEQAGDVGGIATIGMMSTGPALPRADFMKNCWNVHGMTTYREAKM